MGWAWFVFAILLCVGCSGSLLRSCGKLVLKRHFGVHSHAWLSRRFLHGRGTLTLPDHFAAPHFACLAGQRRAALQLPASAYRLPL